MRISGAEFLQKLIGEDASLVRDSVLMTRPASSSSCIRSNPSGR
jgi:ATP-dependent 26S proteasome regulatory subunit